MLSAEPWLKSVASVGVKASAPPRSDAGPKVMEASAQEPSAAEPVEDEEEPVEPVEVSAPASPPAALASAPASAPAAAPAAAEPASTPVFEAVTPSAELNWSAAAGSPFWPLMAEAAVRQAETVASGAWHWSLRRSQMKFATMPGSVEGKLAGVLLKEGRVGDSGEAKGGR